ncbi:MAG: mechanosensitive ion channel [Gammaproteobacteria bacterium]|nr:mechanosensitive ion channel [Gammaproteobacteria bacterium]
MKDFESVLVTWLFDPTVAKIIFTVVGILVIYAGVKIMRRSFARRIKEPSTRYRAHKLIGFLGYIAALFFLVVVFNRQLGGLTIAFGVAGAGVAFALQEVIASLAGWLAISFGNYFKTGDRVLMGGVKGDVIDIGMLRTTIFEIGGWVNGDQYNGRVARVTNSAIFKEPMFNYSGDFPFLWDEIVIPIRHGSEVTVVNDILNAAASEVLGEFPRQAGITWEKLRSTYLLEAAQVAHSVSMTLDENWMTFTLRYVTDFKFRRSTKTKLFSQILTGIEAHKDVVSLATSSQEIDITRVPDLTVSQPSNAH